MATLLFGAGLRVPEALRHLWLRHPRTLHAFFFRTVASTLLDLAADPRHLGARIGFLAILHTWTQTLLYHPHLHVVAPGGGLSVDGVRWVGSRPDYFLPVQVLSRLFSGKLLAGLKTLHAEAELSCTGPLEPLAEPRSFADLLEPLYETEWVVYAKPPFGGPRQVLSYGLLANRDRQEKLARCREALGVAAGDPPQPASEAGWAELLARLTGADPNRCPRCGTGRLHLVAEIPAAGRGPPQARRAS